MVLKYTETCDILLGLLCKMNNVKPASAARKKIAFSSSNVWNCYPYVQCVSIYSSGSFKLKSDSD